MNIGEKCVVLSCFNQICIAIVLSKMICEVLLEYFGKVTML